MIRVRFALVALALTAIAADLSAAASPKLATSASAFIRSQAGSEISWEPWGPEIAGRAKAANKPVYVYIGSFLSELSRATTQQIFTQPDNIKYLNEHFICVIADREEQPELAAYAQYYLQNVKQTSGWPTHLWLTPELNPYEGGGYLPLTEEWGKTSFSKQAKQAGETWTSDPATCRAQAKDALGLMAPAPVEKLAEASTTTLEDKLAKAAAAWRDSFDAAHAGFGASPKWPEPELLRFFLHRSPDDRELALKTLRAMLASPLRDPLDGGFYRYATDAAWRVPYVQKTLGDQARIALALLDAAELTKDKGFAAAAHDALNYALNLANPDGTFVAAEDFTSDDRIIRCVWTEAEIDAALGSDATGFKQAFGVQAAGNVPPDDDPGGKLAGKNFLFHTAPATDAVTEKNIAAALEKLRAARTKKAAPLRDDHATAGAHGLLLAALARGGAELNEPSFTTAAARLTEVVQKQFIAGPDASVRRLAGSSAGASPADYLALALGCREYAKTVKNPDAGALADKLTARATSQFFDAAQGRYFASPATPSPGILLRVPATSDVPSADALGLLVGVPAKDAAAIRAALVSGIGEGATPPGDALLALQAK